MKKWSVIYTKEVDQFLTPCESKEKAIEEAKCFWSTLTSYEKTKSTVVAALINVDENGSWFEEENGNIDGDYYDIAWESNKDAENN